jgi:hypothetical protein
MLLNETCLLYTLKEGRYDASRLMVAGGIVTSGVLEGFSLDLKDKFDRID